MRITRPLWLLGLFWPLVLPLALYLAELTGSGFWYWLVPIEMYVLLPVLDEWLGDGNFESQAGNGKRNNDYPFGRYYRSIPILTVPLHLFTMTVSCWYISAFSLHWYDILGISLSQGFNNALAINTAHELGHKQSGLEKWLAKFLLALPAYGHFYVEHNRGHHRHVATAEDPSSARMGESLYRYIVRDVPAEVARAWHLESDRMQRKGFKSFSLKNECLQSWLISLIYYLALLFSFGMIIIPALLVQSIFAWFQIAIANYIEHYGLLRQKDTSGQYRPCKPEHSWNSNRLLSGLVLFNLQLHSDHHANAGKPYQVLESHHEAPNLPAGYPLMFIIALIPPLWRWLMDKRLVEYYGGDSARINRLSMQGHGQ